MRFLHIPIFYQSFFTFYSWHFPLEGQPLHPQPHPLFPAFLSFTFFITIAAKAAAIKIPIIQSIMTNTSLSITLTALYSCYMQMSIILILIIIIYFMFYYQLQAGFASESGKPGTYPSSVCPE